MTRQDVVAILAYITATYPNLTASAATVTAWHDLLADLPAPAVYAAVKRVLQTQTGAWWPDIGTIRRWALAFAGTAVPSADAAWAAVQAAVDRYGYYQPDAALASLPPTVAQVARGLGWDQICLGDPGVVRAHFLRLYEAHVAGAASDTWVSADVRLAAPAAADAPRVGPTPLRAVLEAMRGPGAPAAPREAEDRDG